VEWQLRNWLYFTWLSGDHICEQHVHNLDVVNWALKGHPEKAVGLGGRQVRTDPAFGHIYDHFAIDYEYAGGIHVASYCRQMPETDGNVSEAVVGTKGTWSGTSTPRDHRIRAGEQTVWQYRARGDRDPYVQEHTDLIASIRKGEPLNELRQVAESTLTAIMGRMAAYTGKEVSWERALDSKVSTMPEHLAMNMALPVPAVAMPGTTELI
jgi:predicted dehydrogenase